MQGHFYMLRFEMENADGSIAKILKEISVDTRVAYLLLRNGEIVFDQVNLKFSQKKFKSNYKLEL